MKTTVLNIRPSKLGLIIGCTASPRLQASIPDNTGEAAAIGKRKHSSLALLLRTGKHPKTLEMIKKVSPDEAEYEEVLRTYDWGIEFMPKTTDAVSFIETRLDDMAFLGLEGGTPDWFVLSHKLKYCLLVDWKMGRVRIPGPQFNWQGKGYLAALLRKYPWIETFESVLIQPNSFIKKDCVRSYILTAKEVEAEIPTIKGAVDEAKSDTPKVAAGPHCDMYFCRARETCEVYKAYRVEKAEKKEEVVQANAKATATKGGTGVIVTPDEPLAFPVVAISEEVVEQAQGLMQKAFSMKAIDAVSAQAIGEVSKTIRKLKTQINTHRLAINKPFEDLIKKINSAAKRATDRLDEGVAALDGQVEAFQKREAAERKRIEDERAAAEKKAREDAEAAERERLRIEEAAKEEARKAVEAQLAAEKAAADAKAAALKVEEDAKLAIENAKGKKAKEAAEKAAAELKAKNDAEAAAAKEIADKAAAEAQAKAEQTQRDLEAAEKAKQDAGARIASSSTPSSVGPTKIAGYGMKKEKVYVISDYSKIPAEMLRVVLIPNDKVLKSMVDSGALTPEKDSVWITITEQDVSKKTR